MNTQDTRYSKFMNSMQKGSENILGFDVVKVKDVGMTATIHKAFDMNTDRLCKTCECVSGGEDLGGERYSSRNCWRLGIAFNESSDEHAIDYNTFYCEKWEAKLAK